MHKINKMGYRITAVFLSFTLMCLVSFWRIYLTQSSLPVAQNNNGYRLTVGKMRGTIFDKNLLPLTNDEHCIIAAVAPTPRAITAISREVKGEAREKLLNQLKSGKPALVELDKKIDCDGIVCIDTYKTSADGIANHLIGYTDYTGHGVSGIQYAYDGVLYSEEKISVFYPSDVNNRILLGGEAEITYNESVVNSGVALTIDRNIQRLCEKSMQSVICGAAVVTEIGTGKIRAMVSRPDFDINNLAQYLENADAPLLNRAVLAYNVGSVFKPCVAAALLEQNSYTDFSCTCTGSISINGHTFACHEREGHGIVTLRDALRFSCNSFFYTVAQKMGADSIYVMSKKLGFGTAADLGKISSARGSIDTLNNLKNSPTALANLSIGQGKLLLSPVAVLTLYEAVANGGIYYNPTVVEGIVKGGRLIKNPDNKPNRVMSEKTADKIKQYLIDVVGSGTGVLAKPDLCTAAGKTATAQTGIEKQGRSIENSWFCGFFPAENPKYAVAVLIDDEDKNGTTGAPIFKSIADSITDYENAQKRR